MPLSLGIIPEILLGTPSALEPLLITCPSSILGGSSAGGSLSTVLAHHSRQQKLSPPVTGQWLSVAFISPTEVGPQKYKDQCTSGSLRVDPVLDPGEDEATFKGLFRAIQLQELDDPLVSTLRALPTPSHSPKRCV